MALLDKHSYPNLGSFPRNKKFPQPRKPLITFLELCDLLNETPNALKSKLQNSPNVPSPALRFSNSIKSTSYYDKAAFIRWYKALTEI